MTRRMPVMTRRMPVLTVIAGPNGSGKSTLTAGADFEGLDNLLDPDAIARRIDPANPSSSAIAAAREVLTRVALHLERKESFSVETTLSGGTYLKAMEEARQHGFHVRLIYVCLDNPGRNAQRVQERVRKGGHSVPESDVFRRYRRSLANLPAAMERADETFAFDNSGPAPRKILEARNGSIVWRSPNLPAWAQSIASP